MDSQALDRRRFLILLVLVLLAVLATLLTVRLNAGKPLRPGGEVVDIALSFDGARLIAATTEGLVVWRLPERREAWRVGRAAYSGVAWSADGQLVAAGLRDSRIGEVQLLDAHDGTILATLSTFGGVVDRLAFSPDSQLLATASRDRTVRVWRISRDGGEVLLSLGGSPASFESVAFSPDGQLVAGGSGPVVFIWRLSDGREVSYLQGDAGGMGIAFSSDGRSLAAVGARRDRDQAQPITLWEVPGGMHLRTVIGHKDRVTSVAFSPNGRMVATGSGSRNSVQNPSDTSVRLWRVTDGKLLRSFEGHLDIVRRVLFAPDGRTLISGAEDGTIRFWDVP